LDLAAYFEKYCSESMELRGTSRSRLIGTTEFFADYFGLSHDLKTVKQQLKTIFEKEHLSEAEP